MLLITGMPRSGTTFLTKVFACFGAIMKKPYLCRFGVPSPNDDYTLSEPRSLSLACRDDSPAKMFRDIIKKIELENLKFKQGDETLVVKSPQMIFYPQYFDAFDEIIVCTRPVQDPWLSSMKNHGGISWVIGQPSFLRNHRVKSIKDVGNVWFAQSIKVQRELGSKVIPFELGNRKSERACLSHFLNPIHVDQVIEEMLWNRKAWSKPK